MSARPAAQRFGIYEFATVGGRLRDWNDVEIFSDGELPDSIWRLDDGEAARRASESFERVSAQARTA